VFQKGPTSKRLKKGQPRKEEDKELIRSSVFVGGHYEHGAVSKKFAPQVHTESWEKKRPGSRTGVRQGDVIEKIVLQVRKREVGGQTERTGSKSFNEGNLSDSVKKQKRLKSQKEESKQGKGGGATTSEKGGQETEKDELRGGKGWLNRR